MSPTVVVVEDEAAIREMLSDVLEGFGFHVVGVSRPDSALLLDPDLKPGLFLLDLMLPGIDGIELARRLRDGHFPRTPIIGMSASSVMLRLAHESGIFQYTLAKPFNLPELLNCLERHIARDVAIRPGA